MDGTEYCTRQAESEISGHENAILRGIVRLFFFFFWRRAVPRFSALFVCFLTLSVFVCFDNKEFILLTAG